MNNRTKFLLALLCLTVAFALIKGCAAPSDIDVDGNPVALFDDGYWQSNNSMVNYAYEAYQANTDGARLRRQGLRCLLKSRSAVLWNCSTHATTPSCVDVNGVAYPYYIESCWQANAIKKTCAVRSLDQSDYVEFDYATSGPTKGSWYSYRIYGQGAAYCTVHADGKATLQVN